MAKNRRTKQQKSAVRHTQSAVGAATAKPKQIELSYDANLIVSDLKRTVLISVLIIALEVGLWWYWQ